jgi:hypothetical protein
LPEVDLTPYTNMAPSDLEAIRVALVKKAAGNHDNLDLEDLHTLAAVTGVLRRKASGPPKEAKKPSGPRAKKEPAKPATLDDLA